MKIHFLDETLKKAGPGYHEAALKENTDLKVDRITLQKELAQARKTLTRAERELEQYRLHLQEVQKDIQRKHIDEDLRRELESLKESVAAKDVEIDGLRRKVSTADRNEEEIEKLRGDIEDLEAESREKDRAVEGHEDEIDRLKERLEKDSDELASLREDLESEKKRNDDLEDAQDEKAKQAEQVAEMRQELKDALEAKEQAVNDLQEVRIQSALVSHASMTNRVVAARGSGQQVDVSQRVKSTG